jgi:hypothetical protein
MSMQLSLKLKLFASFGVLSIIQNDRGGIDIGNVHRLEPKKKLVLEPGLSL